MKTFHGDPKIKEKYLARLRAHAAVDEIIQGTGWENGKGCAIGCTLDAYDHSRYPVELGIPEWMARLEDALFERLKNGEAKKFPIRFLEAIPVGVYEIEMEKLKHKYCTYLMAENIKKVSGLKLSDRLKSQVLEAIRTVARLHQDAAETGEWNETAARSAKYAALVARSAALAARPVARSAKYAALAARSASLAARPVAWSVGSAAWATGPTAYKKHADTLIGMLRELEAVPV